MTGLKSKQDSEGDADELSSATVSATVDESETISRTLLLAQRTADTAVAEARAEAERIQREAADEAAKATEDARQTGVRLVEEAREEARQAGEETRVTVQAEVDALKARRDFLESDVGHLERHLTDERSRLREAATTLLELTERVPGGLGEVRPPLLSASDDDAPAGTGGGQQLELSDDGDADGDHAAAAATGSDDPGDALDDTVGLVIQTDIADDDPGSDRATS